MNAAGMKERAFSLVELVIVVVILGVLAAIAIPQFSQGATGGAEADLRTDLAVLRTAIELYHRDHQAYPAQKPTGIAAADAATPAAFVRQLTQYTDAEGRVSVMWSEVFRHGPYMQHGVPPSPVAVGHSANQVHVITGRAAPTYHEAAAEAGWIYNCETGYIAANSPGVDADNVRYDTY